MSEIRKGLPSASSMERLALCPGSANLIASLPPEAVEDSDSPEAARGTRIHDVLAGLQMFELLAAEEKEIVNMCSDLEGRYIEAWVEHLSSQFAPGAMPKIETDFREKRLWLESGKAKFSGQADVCYRCGTNYLVLDYKTGRGEVTPPEENLQLRALAALVYNMDPDATSVFVGIVQPLATWEVSACHYYGDGLDRATEETVQFVLDSQAADAPRVPGEKQCQYCPARVHCPEATGNVVELAVQQPEPTLVANRSLVEMLDQAKAAEAFIKALRAEARKRLEAGETLEGSGAGYRLKPGKRSRKVTDPEAVNAAVGDTVNMMECVSVSLPAVEKRWWEAVKGTKVKKKDAMEQLAQLLAGAVEIGQDAPSLTRYTPIEGGTTS